MTGREKSASCRFTFQCRDAGITHCDWVGNAMTEELLLLQIEQHALEHHNLIVDNKERIRAAIRRYEEDAGKSDSEG
jgi:predicted small metal-binding protein